MVKFKSKQLHQNIRRQLDKALVKVSKEMEKDLKLKVSNLFPPASRPGFPPKRRTGDLRNSIKTRKSGKNTISIFALMYGLFLEKGTRDIRSRPWIVSTIRENMKKYTRILTKAFRR